MFSEQNIFVDFAFLIAGGFVIKVYQQSSI